MKYLLTLLLMGIIHCGYSQNKTDILLREASNAYGQEDFQRSLQLLKQINAKDKSKEYVDRLTLLNYHKLLLEEDYPSFTSLSQLRDRSEIFIKRYPRSKWLAEVVAIFREMNTYPRTLSEYDKKRSEDKQRMLKLKQTNLLNAIKISYQSGNYNESLQGIKDARANGYNSSQVQYYDLFIKYYNLQKAPVQSYNELNDLRNLFAALKTNSDFTLSEIEVQSIADIYSKLPKSQEEFKKLEDARLLALKLAEMKKKFETIDRQYKAAEYTQVTYTTNDFPDKSDEQLKVAYYQVMSRYQLLAINKVRTLNDIMAVRTALQGYLTKHQSQNQEFKNHVNKALLEVNTKYPKSQIAFNAIVNKKKKEELAIIRKANRKTFTSFGYEYGEFAPYGLRFETGGHFLGFFTTLRYGMKTKEELQDHYYASGDSQPNKSEIILGPNFKIAKWLYLNVGGGYGVYSHLYRNDYANELGTKSTSYIAGYGGVTLRAGNVINLIGGASFIDIDKQLSKSQIITPEFTVGITFNIK